MFEVLKRYFGLGYYDEERIMQFVKAGWITKEEAAEITGGQKEGKSKKGTV